MNPRGVHPVKDLANDVPTCGQVGSWVDIEHSNGIAHLGCQRILDKRTGHAVKHHM